MATNNMACEADQILEMQRFSADASIYNIMLEYLQPFELACITEKHTKDTYDNAAECGSIEYLTLYKSVCHDLNRPLIVAAKHGQLECITLLLKLGAYDINWALSGAEAYGQYKTINMLIKFRGY